MKQGFEGYFPPTESEFEELLRTAIVVLDTSVLLDLYELPSSVRSDMFSTLRKLKSQERLWLPHQVAIEYHRNRSSAISDQAKPLETIGTARKQLEDVREKLQKLSRHALLDGKECEQIIAAADSALKEQADKTKAGLLKPTDDDPIRDELADIYDDITGPSATDKDVEQWIKEAQSRFKREVPPGYMDLDKKRGRPETHVCGDYFLWKQMLAFCSDVKKPLILVINDQTEDWYQLANGRPVGPHPLLRQEVHDKCGQAFYMYRDDEFLRRMSASLGVNVDPTILTDVTEIRDSAADEHRRLERNWRNLIAHSESRRVSDPVRDTPLEYFVGTCRDCDNLMEFSDRTLDDEVQITYKCRVRVPLDQEMWSTEYGPTRGPQDYPSACSQWRMSS